jgi:SHS2 domain-containing protein
VGFRFLDSGTTADIRFRARGSTLEKLLAAAVDAVVSATAGDPRCVRARVECRETLRAESEEMLLFDLLQRVIFHKDASGLVLRLTRAQLAGGPGAWSLEALLAGERVDPARHSPGSDVKAVTLHGYRVRRRWHGWAAEVVLDV